MPVVSVQAAAWAQADLRGSHSVLRSFPDAVGGWPGVLQRVLADPEWVPGRPQRVRAAPRGLPGVAMNYPAAESRGSPAVPRRRPAVQSRVCCVSGSYPAVMNKKPDAPRGLLGELKKAHAVPMGMHAVPGGYPAVLLKSSAAM